MPKRKFFGDFATYKTTSNSHLYTDLEEEE